MTTKPDSNILQSLARFQTVDLLDSLLRDEKFDYSSLDHLRGIQAPTLFLGLGGGGTKTVALLKELFTRTFSAVVPHEASSRIPEGYQFLAFDSDTRSAPSILSKGVEWVQLEGDGLGHGVYEEKLRSDYYKAWVPQDVPPRDFATGCQGFRTLGRLLFNLNLNKVQKAVFNAINKATNAPKLDLTDLTIYIFCTLAGGTGSGCLLDAAFMLRQARPDAKIRAVLACAEGFGGNNELMDRAKCGVFSALREIDHFMSGNRLSDWLEERNERNFPGYLGSTDPSQRGRYGMGDGMAVGHLTKPFNECLLVGQADNEGITLAQSSDMLSLFMARVAFCATAYPNGDKARGQGFESNLNNHQQEFLTERLGNKLSYCVPGFTSFHAPVGRALELCGMKAAVTLLHDLRGGACHKDHRQEAVQFLSKLAISGEEARLWLRKKVDAEITINRSALEENRKALETSERYGRGADIMKPFERFYGNDGYVEESNRFQERCWQEPPDQSPALKPSGERDIDASPYTVQEKLAVFQQSLVEHCNMELRTAGRRRAALDDFLSDLLVELDAVLEEAGNEASLKLRSFENTRKNYLDGSSDEEEGSITRGKLSAATTKERRGIAGLLEPMSDSSLAAKLATDYESMAMSAGITYQQVVFSRMWKQFITDLVEQVTRMKGKAEKFFSASIQAQRTLESLIRQRATELHTESEGKGTALETGFSFNLMDGAWRQRFEEEEKLEDPVQVQSLGDVWLNERQKLELATNAKAAQVKQQQPPVWNPLEVLDLADDRGYNPTGKPLEACVAQYICDFLGPWFDAKTKWFGDSQDGQGLRRVLLFTKQKGESEGEAMRRLTEWLRSKCRPQWDVSLNQQRFSVQQSEILLLCGPQKLTGDMIATAGFAEANTTLTYEQGRLQFFTLALPVGLAGSTRIFDPLGSTYDRHVGGKVREANTSGSPHNPRKRWSAYPESWEWKDPRELVHDEGETNPALLACLAIGRLSENAKVEPQVKAAFEAYRTAFSKTGKKPKEKQPGIWISGERFWLAPEVHLPLDGSAMSPLDKEAVELGGSLSNAFEKLHGNEELRNAALGWLHWWKDNSTELFTDKERGDFITGLRDWLLERADTCDVGSPDERRWRRLQAHARSLK